MFQYKQTNKKTGITYLYQQESYWVPELHQSRSRRVCLGKYTESGELVPTGKRGRKPKVPHEPVEPSSELEKLTCELKSSQQKVKELELTIQELQRNAERERKVRSQELQKVIQSLQKLQ